MVPTTYTYVPVLDVEAPGKSSGSPSRVLDAIVMVGTPSIVMPSALEAASAVLRVEESEAFTAAAVVEAGTAMVAVMITLAAVMAMITGNLSSPAAAPIFCCKLNLSLSE